ILARFDGGFVGGGQSVFPRVNDIDVYIREVPDVPRCNRETVNFGCPGDQRIPQVQHAPRAMRLRPELGSPLCPDPVQGQDAVLIRRNEL
ncbi:MAG: hypothetical protein J4F35_16560, partial [Candidatus Latescibacteria bacterium]|nr:hypothetical protein [Candidatus Latescibacterota bacterium]